MTKVCSAFGICMLRFEKVAGSLRIRLMVSYRVATQWPPFSGV
jgi:hypothetical protein